MKKFKKIFAFVLTAAMVVCSMPNYGVETDAATHEDVITGATSSKTTKGFEITEKGVKVTFDATITHEETWHAPQFVVYAADDDLATSVVTDPADEDWYFVARSDNYAFDKSGNRWVNTTALASGNGYINFGEYSKTTDVTLESSYTMLVYKLGDSAVIVFGNEDFTSTSRVKLDNSKTNYVAIIAEYCDITNIVYEELNQEVVSLGTVDSSSGYMAAFSDAIPVTDKPVYISGMATSVSAEQNYYGAYIFVYNGETMCAAIRPDCFSNTDLNVETLNGYSRTIVASYGGEWAAWNTRCVAGVGMMASAKVSGTDAIVTFGNDNFGCTVTIPNIDLSKGVTVKVGGEKATVSNISVSSEADYYDITSYRSGSEYTAPTKAGKIFAGWFTDNTFETAVADDVTTGYAYAKFVDANLLAPKYQLSAGTTAQSDSTNVRVMLGVDTLDYSDLGFEIEYKASEYPYNSTTVYSGISVGNTVEEPSTYFGSEANYMLPYVLRGLTNENFDETFTVRAYWVTLDGTKVYGAERTFTAGDNL